MAALADEDRQALWADWMRENRESLSITKADLRAAVNGLDDYVSDNAVAINNAIPQPARGALSVAQKAHLLNFVVARRYIARA